MFLSLPPEPHDLFRGYDSMLDIIEQDLLAFIFLNAWARSLLKQRFGSRFFERENSFPLIFVLTLEEVFVIIVTFLLNFLVRRNVWSLTQKFLRN